MIQGGVIGGVGELLEEDGQGDSGREEEGADVGGWC